MRKLYIAIALGIVFLAAWLIDWNIRQGSAYLSEDQGSTIISRDDDLLEIELGYPGGKAPMESRGTVPGAAGGSPALPPTRQPDSGEKTVIRMHESEPEWTPPPADDPTANAGWFLYEVKRGDTLSEIAQKHLGTSRRVNEIMELNGIQDARRIQAGMKLKIPNQ